MCECMYHELVLLVINEVVKCGKTWKSRKDPGQRLQLISEAENFSMAASSLPKFRQSKVETQAGTACVD